MGRIVVGVDASPGARRALAWAAAEARLRQAVLQVVHAYHSGNLATPVFFGSVHTRDADVAATGEPSPPELSASVHSREALEEVARSQADELLDALLEEVDRTIGGVQVERTVVDDRHPAEALVALSADADLLVVGSRGRGGFTELLLGSVSHAAVLHAACPVVVVPSDHGKRGPGQAPP